MYATVCRSASVCLASLALVFSFGAAPACALQAAGAMPDSVRGVVTSVESRVVPSTGQIVTDVVVESPSVGGTSSTRFSMRGGEVGGILMWTEEFAELRVGDSVTAEVLVSDGEACVVAPPVVDAGPSHAAAGVHSSADPVADGYVWTGAHWPDSSRPVSYYVNPAGLPVGAVSVITAGAQTWEDDPGSFMDFTYAGATSTSTNANDLQGVNIVDCRDFGDSGGTRVAQCALWIDPATMHILEFDISFNARMLPGPDIAFVATHEFGHTLKLDDLYEPENIGQVMYGTTSSTAGGVLGWGDIAGIRAIYSTPPPMATSITIKTAATSATSGKTVTLSGAVTPTGMIGQNIVVYVKKPGSTRWTYSSNRTAYALGGGVAWQYKYYFKPGMAKGLYTYKAVVPEWPGYMTSTSPTMVSIRLK